MIQIDHTLCTGCGLCARDCITGSISMETGKAAVIRSCILCGHCVAVCPAGAVSNPDYGMEDVEAYEKDSFTLQTDTLLHAIKFRRSIRDYKAQPVEDWKLEKLLQAGRYTATAKNNQSCHFVFVQKELNALRRLVWDDIDRYANLDRSEVPEHMRTFVALNRRRKKNPADDYLFRNAPVVAYITSEWLLDAGLAAQNMELTAVSMGLGVMFNGFLAEASNQNEALKRWLGIEGKTIKACMLLGYPAIAYRRTAPRRKPDVTWK